MRFSTVLIAAILGISVHAVIPNIANAQGRPNCDDPDSTHPKCGGDDGGDTGGGFEWMHGDVGAAHQLGFTGTGSHMVILDSHADGNPTYSGNLDGTTQNRTHGGWTSLEAHLVAPGASVFDLDHAAFNAGTIADYFLATTGVNVVNLSFGWVDPAGQDVDFTLGEFYGSIADEATAANAVFVKAAGNTNGGTVDGSFAAIIDNQIATVEDYLNLGLIGTEGAIFVGALNKNGTTKQKASITRYSTIAGSNTDVQDMFLTVGVDSRNNGGLEGTSFAAPIITGYAAIIGNKFNADSPATVVDRLLLTAREDTIRNYSVSVHGQGEACLACALSPGAIN